MISKSNINKDDSNKHSLASDMPEDKHRMISEAAYFMSESQGFCGSHTLQNWLDAEAQFNETHISDKPCH